MPHTIPIRKSLVQTRKTRKRPDLATRPFERTHLHNGGGDGSGLPQEEVDPEPLEELVVVLGGDALVLAGEGHRDKSGGDRAGVVDGRRTKTGLRLNRGGGEERREKIWRG